MGAGERWKSRRESLGLTLEEVSTDLRISRKYLNGMEEGCFDGWPERVFSSGFIRSYAKLLGEDPEPVLAEYLSSGIHGADLSPSPAVAPHWTERERRRGNRMFLYGVAAACVLAVGFVLSVVSSRCDRPPVVLPVPDQVSSPPIPQVQDNAAPVPRSVADNVAPMAAAQFTAADNAPSQIPVGGVPAGQGKATSPYQLFLEASEQTWIMYSMDEAEPVDVMLYPGDRISIDARNKISLKLGNAGGVLATLNGKRLPPFGSRGQVKVVTLGE